MKSDNGIRHPPPPVNNDNPLEREERGAVEGVIDTDTTRDGGAVTLTEETARDRGAVDTRKHLRFSVRML